MVVLFVCLLFGIECCGGRSSIVRILGDVFAMRTTREKDRENRMNVLRSVTPFAFSAFVLRVNRTGLKQYVSHVLLPATFVGSFH